MGENNNDSVRVPLLSQDSDDLRSWEQEETCVIVQEKWMLGVA